jgi:hypothetical protein
MQRKPLAMPVGIGCLLACCLSYGQSASMTPFDKLPDWTGVWSMMGGTIFDRATQTGEGGSVTPGVREHPPYNTEYEKVYQSHLALRDADRYPDVFSNCGVPAGYPRILNLPDAYEFVVRPDLFYIIAENGGNTMRVYTDGRKLPAKEDTWGTYTGVSVGHWEGDTLVIVSTNFKRWVLDDYFYTDPKEYRMHSDELTTTERLQWKDKDTISYVMTIDDPKIFTKPWSQEFQIKPKPEWDKVGLFEYVCEENNRCPGGKCAGN